MELSGLCVRCGRAGDLRLHNVWLWQVCGDEHICPECLHGEDRQVVDEESEGA